MEKQWVVSSFASTSTKETINNATVSKKRRREKYEHEIPDEIDKKCQVNLNYALWVDKYPPRSETELAVHKKKVEEVRYSLENIFQRKNKTRILLLHGPSGAGKTALLKFLSEDMKFGIKEWDNNPGLNYLSGQHIFVESQSDTFREFILITSKYSLSEIFQEKTFLRYVVLLEEFPSFIFRDASEFWEILRIYNNCGRHPLVLIITDDNKSTFIERKLLPKVLQEELQIVNISINPVAITKLTQCLKRIVEAEKLEVNQELISNIASNSCGDIRAAINSLQFSTDTSIKKSTRSIHSKSRPKKSAKVESVNKASIAILNSKDESLFLLHALGMILHCKRADALDERLTLPEPLKNMERRPPNVDPEDIWRKTSTSANNVVAFLHQNYLDFTNDFERSADYLSSADLFNSEWTGSENVSFDPYIFSVASRGAMFCSSDLKMGWKPLHAPRLFDVEKERISRVKNAKELLKGEFFGNSEANMFSEIIPYLCKIRPHACPPEMFNISKIPMAFTSSQRHHDDVPLPNYEEHISKDIEEMQFLSERKTHDEEFDIEEFDD